MRLFYDNIVYNLQRAGGISTYWYELSKRFLQNDDVEIHFLECSGDFKNINRAMLDLEDCRSFYKLRFNIFIERFLKVPVQCDSKHAIFHSSYFRLPSSRFSGKKVITVHDFTHDYFYSGPRKAIHNYVKKKSINESDLIITVSENTKRDLVDLHSDIDPSKVRVIYNGVSDDFKPIQKSEGRMPYFLYVGSRDVYKNFDFAVNLVSHYNNFALHVVGAALSKSEKKLLQEKVRDRYEVFNHIGIKELNEKYNNAVALIYPSSYEGFGIPILEAMKAGCPFIALNASSIPEVSGDAGILINALKMDEAMDGVERIFSDRGYLIEKGLLQSSLFSWDKCYKETYNAYKYLM